MRTRTSYYKECDIVESSGTILKSASENTCLGDRRCVNGQTLTDDLPYVGYDPFGTCTCSTKPSTVSNAYATENRYKRQVNEPIVTTASNTRVLRAENGGKRKAVDTTREIRGIGYGPARLFAMNTDGNVNTNDL